MLGHDIQILSSGSHFFISFHVLFSNPFLQRFISFQLPFHQSLLIYLHLFHFSSFFSFDLFHFPSVSACLSLSLSVFLFIRLYLFPSFCPFIRSSVYIILHVTYSRYVHDAHTSLGVGVGWGKWGWGLNGALTRTECIHNIMTNMAYVG